MDVWGRTGFASILHRYCIDVCIDIGHAVDWHRCFPHIDATSMLHNIDTIQAVMARANVNEISIHNLFLPSNTSIT